MDPYLNSLAYKFLAETQEDEVSESNQHRAHKSEWSKDLRRRLGVLLVTIGQKMQESALDTQAIFEDGGYPSLEDEACA